MLAIVPRRRAYTISIAPLPPGPGWSCGCRSRYLSKDGPGIGSALATWDIERAATLRLRSKYALVGGDGRWHTKLPLSVQPRCLKSFSG